MCEPFIIFSYDDVCGVRYRSDYDVEFKGKNLSLWCEVKFDKMKKLVQFRFDADLRYEDGEVEIIGSVGMLLEKQFVLLMNILLDNLVIKKSVFVAFYCIS